ncbi:MAG: ATP-binding protein, partial [Deltaproteobacteria bacterium]
SLILKGMATDDPIRPDIEEILKAERRAVALIKQLMLFSRKQSVQKTTVALNGLITELKEMAKRLIGENITLEVSSVPDLKPVLADAGQLEQVLINLLVNARDAMPNGGLLKLTAVNVDLSGAACKCPEPVEPGRQFVKISVADSGTGMDRNTLDHLFEPFFTTKPKGTGTGLGLSIVYGIVKQHNGWIDAHSEVGKGSVFTVYLPQASGTVNKPALEEAARDLRGHGERVLVVEDEETLRKITVRMLKENGYDPVEARTVSEAVSIISGKNANFRIIFTDLILSDRNGTELINELKKAAPGIDFVFTSGYLDDRVKLEFIQNQGCKFIQKPYSTETVLKIFNELL